MYVVAGAGVSGHFGTGKPEVHQAGDSTGTHQHVCQLKVTVRRALFESVFQCRADLVDAAKTFLW